MFGAVDAQAREGCIEAKRHVNDAIRETLGQFRDDEPIPFFCECGDERCCRAVWLTAPEYDGAREEPARLALFADHLAGEGPARAVVSSAGAAATHERIGRITV
jgi:hypothetical protein